MGKRMIIAAVCGLAAPSAVWAQEEADPPPAADNPLLTDTSADQLLRERLERPSSGISVSPAQGPTVGQVEPGQMMDVTRLDLADGSSAWTEDGTLRPEGTYLVAWLGEVARLRTGGLAFLPVTGEGQTPEPAMLLTPSGVYGRIASAVGEAERGTWLRLTGEVLEYRGRNYLLPTAFTTAEPPTAAELAGVEGEQPEAEPETPTGGQPSGNPVDDLVAQLEAERRERRGIDTIFGDGGAAATPGPRLDGRMLLSQRARMVRSSDGGWVLAMDNDRADPGLELPHRLRLLPCRVVEQMERQAERRGESWDFEVSGQLYRHGATVYLLPRMFVTLAGKDIQPLQ